MFSWTHCLFSAGPKVGLCNTSVDEGLDFHALDFIWNAIISSDTVHLRGNRTIPGLLGTD